MERTTFSVSFYIRRARANKKGECPIQVRITVNKMRADTTVKKTVLPGLWNERQGWVIERNHYAKELNMYLDSVRSRFIRIHRDMENEDEQYITAQSVMDRYLGRDKPERRTLLEVFREHNEKCRALEGIDMAPATVQRYATSIKHTEDFIKHNYKRDDIYLDEIKRSFIEDYEMYLKTVRKCNHNTTVKYLKNFKKIILIAVANEWMAKDPFSDVRFSLQPVERDFLEKHELQKLVKKPIEIERLEQVRDIFAFCCFTGLAFSDVKQLTPDHIAMDINGAKWIRKPRQKTGNMCNIPLVDVPLRIIDKYRDNPYCVANGVLLPVMCNQKMNAYLKELADICGIKKQLTTHTARHTFATFTLANGVSIENVAKMLGHSDTKMTRHYAKILDSTIMREMSRIETFDTVAI